MPSAPGRRRAHSSPPPEIDEQRSSGFAGEFSPCDRVRIAYQAWITKETGRSQQIQPFLKLTRPDSLLWCLTPTTKLGNCLNSLIFSSCCTISRLRILSQVKC